MTVRTAVASVARGLAGAPQRALVAAIRGYRLLLRPWLGNACRFAPTCSQYAIDAIERHGAWHGTLLAGWRLARCQPWCDGGCDPVPDRPLRPVAGHFTRLWRPTEGDAIAAPTREPDR